MKRYLKYIEVLTVVLFTWLLVGCSEKELNAPEDPETDPSVLLNGEEMPVRIAFNLTGERPSVKTKSSILTGNEDPTEYVKDMYMLCFTKEGIYLGYREADLTQSDEGLFTDAGHLDCFGRELLVGSVPARTARIHFLANVSRHIPAFDFDKVGTMEAVIMRSTQMASDIDDERICYWGFHAEENSTKMGEWLSKKVGDEYVKNGGIVHLIRDRARIVFNTMKDDPADPSSPGNEYRITEIKWILSNGLKKGFLAPYKSSSSERYDNNYISVDQEGNLVIDENRHSPYNLNDAERYVADDENEMMTVCTWDRDHHLIDNTNRELMLYMFEDMNDAQNPPKLILKVTYQKKWNDAQSDIITKYHTLMLLDDNNQPLKVLRNHSYLVNITSIPWEGLGHMTFMDAVNSTDYENNITVSIDDKVDDVTNGRYELSILGGTSKIYQTGANTFQTINFEFKPTEEGLSLKMTEDPANPLTREQAWSAMMSGTNSNSFKINWDGDVDASCVDPNVLEITDWHSGTGEGTITLKLGTSIGTELQSGNIVLQHIETNLSRKIHIYTISAFDYRRKIGTAFVPLTLEATGETNTVNGVSCPEYKLTMRIPVDYPEGLYPIRVRMATTTLSPFKYVVDGVDNNDINVETATTENGKTLDGEVLAGINTVTVTNKWNTATSPWNYWYFFDIIVKPSGDQSKEYTIYFNDVRGLRAAANRADGVGLFLKIKYFGDAQSAYVIAP